ncbi:hypothetical protein FRB90_006914, partial [Tulasnella sp. 427]
SWKTWAPNIYADYLDCHTGITSRDPSLDLVHPFDAPDSLPFASLTANLGPQTVCHHHRDIKNKCSGGLCAIKALGTFDSTLGGHLVLHELGLIVEIPSGDTVFFPSAVISHETIPIGADETRYSLVWYSAGGLFRWRDSGFQLLTEWAGKDRAAYDRHQNEGETRWNDGWRKFSTLSELTAKANCKNLS